METKIQKLVDHMARCFAGGELARLVQPFSFPMPLYVVKQDSWVILEQQSDMAQLMAKKRTALGQYGCMGVQAIAENVHVRSSTEGRIDAGIEADIRWLHLDPDGQPRVETLTKYYLKDNPEGLRIEMAEIVVELEPVSNSDALI